MGSPKGVVRGPGSHKTDNGLLVGGGMHCTDHDENDDENNPGTEASQGDVASHIFGNGGDITAATENNLMPYQRE